MREAPSELRFLLDEHLSRRVAQGLRKRQVDAAAVTEPDYVHLRRATDEEILESAAAEPRAVVTYDRGDFTDLHRTSVLTGRRHAGIVLIPQHPNMQPSNIGALVKALEELARSGRSIAEQLVWLEPAD